MKFKLHHRCIIKAFQRIWVTLRLILLTVVFAAAVPSGRVLALSFNDESNGDEQLFPSKNIRLVRKIGGISDGLVMQDSYIYLMSGSSFLTVDVSEPSQPKILNSSPVLGDILWDINLHDQKVYIAAGSGGFWIFDVQNPAEPVPITHISSEDYATDITLYEHYAYLADSNGGMRIIDLSDIQKPVEVGRYGEEVWDAQVFNAHLYISSKDGVEIMDLSNPAKPSTLWRTKPAVDYFTFSIHQNYLLIVDHNKRLNIWDISDPKWPEWRTSIAAPGIGSSGSAGKYLWLNSFPAGFDLYDLSDGTKPIKLSRFEPRSSITGAVVKDDLLFLTEYDGVLMVYDISDVRLPDKVGQLRLPGVVDRYLRNRNHLFLSSGEHVLVYDIANILSPNLMYEFENDMIGDNAKLLEVQGDRLFIEGGYEKKGLFIFDVSNPLNPHLIQHITAFLQVEDVAVHQNYLIEAHDRGIAIFDISDLAKPKYVASYPVSGIVEVDFWEEKLVILTSNALQIWDLKDPAEVRITGRVDNIQKGVDMMVSGDLVYVAEEGNGVSIYAVSQPDLPRLVSYISLPEGANCVEVFGKSLAVGMNNGLRIFDVSNPFAPVETGYIQDDVYVDSLVRKGNYYLGGSNGISVYKFHNPLLLLKTPILMKKEAIFSR